MQGSAAIETEDDEVVTPYTSAFLSEPRVTDVTLQEQCPHDHADHLAMPYDSAAPQDVVQALDGAPSSSADCGLGLPRWVGDGRRREDGWWG